MHPRAIGRRVEVRTDLSWVVVDCDGEEVARHRRSWAPHRTLTEAAHARARRRRREERDPARPSADLLEVEERDLGAYDRALGVA